MDTLLKEYGGLTIAVMGYLFGMILLHTIVGFGQQASRTLVANITGVSYEETEYIQEE